MKHYFAPMEGITGYVHRNAYQTYYPYIDKYFTAFIAPNQSGRFSSREREDICPEHNRGCHTIPQMMTNNAADFILTAEKLWEYGYREVNLNLGCPSKTVVNKFRGSGFLAKPQELDEFLGEVFDELEGKMSVSVKTRIGKDSPEEFAGLMDIYNRYPLKELIIHPRTQQDFYNHTPNLEVFGEGLRASKCPVCYNGDIFTIQDYREFCHKFPEVEHIMLGRGLLKNPALLQLIKQGGEVDKAVLRAFHDKIYREYQEILFGEKVVLFKMKELWFYMLELFENSRKLGKKIKKAESLAIYEDVVDAIFDGLNIVKMQGN